MIDYPKKLDIIFEKLNTFHIKPIIVGGYIRDYLLNIPSKDIDIELYGVRSFEKVEIILKEFGDVNSVGKSFGVCKLKYKDLDLDFSLPREDSKIALGHKGFEVITHTNIDFKTAASRRDFTINSMGYDIDTKEFLDPFHGKEDLRNKILRATNLSKFSDDPLRVLRAVRFSTRFNFTLEKELFIQCKNMIQKNLLDELAKERIFDEIQKLLLKADKPSLGFSLLKKLNTFVYFKELALLEKKEFENILLSLDYARANITLMLALLASHFKDEILSSFLHRVTNKKELIRDITTFVESQDKINLDSFLEYDVYKLATYVNIELFTEFLSALYLHTKDKEIDNLCTKAKKINVFNKKAGALLQGKDLIQMGMKPSKKFSQILSSAYESQMQAHFSNHKEAVQWLEENINSF